MGAEVKNAKIGAVIRPLCAADICAVRQILPEAPGAANWSDKSLEELLTWSGCVALASEVEGEVLGFLFSRQVSDEAEILNLGVTAARRRQGDGGKLLMAVLAAFRGRGVNRVFLEVRESNEAAIAFYMKSGFTKTGSRPGYYRDPAEAAVLMEKKLTG